MRESLTFILRRRMSPILKETGRYVDGMRFFAKVVTSFSHSWRNGLCPRFQLEKRKVKEKGGRMGFVQIIVFFVFKLERYYSSKV